jgi:hypothetical protein
MGIRRSVWWPGCGSWRSMVMGWWSAWWGWRGTNVLGTWLFGSELGVVSFEWVRLGLRMADEVSYGIE